jgi:hypothetical protein
MEGEQPMKTIWTSMLLIILLCSIAVSAQAQMEAPKPAPELKKLDYFAGNWKTEGDMKPGPGYPGGKVSGVDHYEWMKGSFFVVGHSDFKATAGDGTELSVMGYDATEKVYTYAAFNSGGQRETAKGTFEGDTWTWNSNETMGGMHSRYIVKILSPTSYTFKFELSQDGTTWLPAMEGKATKTE